MRPRSRRSVLAAAGATLLGGCLGGGTATESETTATAGPTSPTTDSEATAEPFDGPPPLGRDAVPEGRRRRRRSPTSAPSTTRARTRPASRPAATAPPCCSRAGGAETRRPPRSST
ncbi:hypothetical protein ACFQRB_04835 [Halobaculum litoreum]|uniref:Uncharacterized protein n=1 Tax=Halobaculum litoreum TaxID=3031998 RepID=A0ABD5XLL8_9EURY